MQHKIEYEAQLSDRPLFTCFPSVLGDGHHLPAAEEEEESSEPGERAAPSSPVLSRAQRARYRLSFAERLARNARVSSASRPLITLFGVPETFSAFLGLKAT